MKRIILLILLQTTYLYAGEFVATPHMNDGYHSMSYEEESYYKSLFPANLQEHVLDLCIEYMVPIKYLYRVAYIESKHGKLLIGSESNGTTSIGYCQLNSASINWFADKYNNGRYFNPYNHKDNLRIATMYLRDLYERFNGDWMDSICAYNWGSGNMRRGNVVPRRVFEYAGTVVWGPAFVPCVEVIALAVEGIM